MATQADDITRITGILVHDHITGGKAAALRQRAWPPWGKAGLGVLAKATGCTPDQIEAFESGQAVPTTQQALAWLSELHRQQPHNAGDRRPVGELEGTGAAWKPPARINYDPAALVLADNGKRRTFEPDLSRLVDSDVARAAQDIATHCGWNPRKPGTLRNPVLSFWAIVAAQTAAGEPVRVTHTLSRENVVIVHDQLAISAGRLVGDSVLGPVAARLAASWEQHVRWRPADGRRRPKEGPEDDDGS